jgi:hypothetical protein
MRKALYILTFLTLFIEISSIGQGKYPEDYFRSPLDIPLRLSGTFGELRSDHFHAGIDLRTNETEGYKIYAIADAYVSRIKVSPFGYGKAIYLTHPNGYVSVYGHLQSYSKEVNEFVKRKQYDEESYAVDIYPSPGEIVFKKNDIIGYTGNSGGSGGPHLHFEIRDEASQKPINPLLFGFKVPDHNKPTINLLKVYSACPGFEINPNPEEELYYTIPSDGNYKLNKIDTIAVSGDIYLGIHTFDPFNNGLNKNGIYELSMYVDSALHYSHKVETFSFAETRYINSLIDYSEFKNNRRRVQKAYIQAGNELSIYNGVKDKGKLHFSDNKSHLIEFRASDIEGNTARLRFYIKSIQNNCNPLSLITAYDDVFKYNQQNVFTAENCRFVIPANALYQDLNFTYQVSPKVKGALSETHHIHTDKTPIHKSCDLSISSDAIPKELTDKVFIARLIDNDDPEYFGGLYRDGTITTKTREFGNYCIMADTIKPKITPLNITDQKDISTLNSIKVKIEDELSGIDTYHASLNGKWILMEYDAKNDLLTYYFDDHLTKGINYFELKIADNRQNQNTYKAKLVFNQ